MESGIVIVAGAVLACWTSLAGGLMLWFPRGFVRLATVILDADQWDRDEHFRRRCASGGCRLLGIYLFLAGLVLGGFVVRVALQAASGGAQQP